MGVTEIFADAALQEFAIEQHVVMTADDDDLGAGITALRQMIEFADELAAAQRAVDDDQVRRRAVDIVRDRGRNAAHVHADVGLRQPAVFGGVLQHLGGALVVAESLDRDARYGRAFSEPADPSPAASFTSSSPSSSADCACLDMCLSSLNSLTLTFSSSDFSDAGDLALDVTWPNTSSRRSALRGLSVRGPSRSAGLAIIAARLCWFEQPKSG